jgi:hypothetical protein
MVQRLFGHIVVIRGFDDSAKKNGGALARIGKTSLWN